MIVWFTGTGNSRACARALAHMLGDETLDSFHFIRDGVAAELCSDKPWVFAAPTYAWQLPRVFADFIRSGRFTGSREAYFVMTCGSDIGAAGKKLAALCGEKGVSYRGVLPVLMPENYVAMFDVPDEPECRRIVAAAGPVLERAAELIRQRRPFPAPRTGLADALKSGPVNRAFYRFGITARPFTATDACGGCGACESLCPLGNIRLEGGRPLWGRRCTHCMACICGCPTQAIEYGRKSQGKRRYRCAPFGEESAAGE